MQLSGKEYECRTCGRRFESFQALGGHRASHKKPKLSGEADEDIIKMTVTKVRVHECWVCGLEFATGQALGGHMRRHRGAADEGLVEKKSTTTTTTSFSGKRVLLDLNFPPLEEDGKLGLGLGLGLGLVCW